MYFMSYDFKHSSSICGFNIFLTKTIKRFNADVIRRANMYNDDRKLEIEVYLNVHHPLAFSSPTFINNIKLSLLSDEIMELFSQRRENRVASTLPVYLLLSSSNSCSVRQASDFDSFKMIIA